MADKIRTTGSAPTDTRGGNVVRLADHRPVSPARFNARRPQEMLDDELDFIGDMFIDPAAGPQCLVAPPLDPGITLPRLGATNGTGNDAVD